MLHTLPKAVGDAKCAPLSPYPRKGGFLNH
nr:MAG TPA: hypothetical protein [Caudoviricetes sp.]